MCVSHYIKVFIGFNIFPQPQISHFHIISLIVSLNKSIDIYIVNFFRVLLQVNDK